MNRTPYHLSMSMLCSLLTLAAQMSLAGCGAAPGDSTDNGDGPAEDIQLSASSLEPGQLLTITHESIREGSNVAVMFSGQDGYELTIESFNTTDGSVMVMVPPYAEGPDAALSSGAVTVSVAGIDSEQSLFINELPSLEGVAPGAVYEAMLEETITFYQELRDDLTATSGQDDTVTADETLAALDSEIQTMQQELLAFQTTGELTVSTPEGETVTLSDTQLEELDRYLAANISGLVQAMGLDANAARTVQQGESLDDGTPLGGLREGMRQIANETRRGFHAASLLGGLASLGAGAYGYAAGWALGPVGGLVTIGIAAVVASFRLGGGAAVSAVEQSIGDPDRDNYDAAQTLADGVTDVVITTVGVTNPVANTIGMVRTGVQMADDWEQTNCGDNQQLSPDMFAFCSAPDDDQDTEDDDQSSDTHDETDAIDTDDNSDDRSAFSGVDGCWRLQAVSSENLSSSSQILEIENGQLTTIWGMDGSIIQEVTRFNRPNVGIFDLIDNTQQSVTANADQTVFSLTYSFDTLEEIENAYTRLSGDMSVTITNAVIAANEAGEKSFTGDLTQSATFYQYDDDDVLVDSYPVTAGGTAVGTAMSCPDPSSALVYSEEEINAQLEGL